MCLLKAFCMHPDSQCSAQQQSRRVGEAIRSDESRAAGANACPLPLPAISYGREARIPLAFLRACSSLRTVYSGVLQLVPSQTGLLCSCRSRSGRFMGLRATVRKFGHLQLPSLMKACSTLSLCSDVDGGSTRGFSGNCSGKNRSDTESSSAQRVSAHARPGCLATGKCPIPGGSFCRTGSRGGSSHAGSCAPLHANTSIVPLVVAPVLARLLGAHQDQQVRAPRARASVGC